MNEQKYYKQIQKVLGGKLYSYTGLDEDKRSLFFSDAAMEIWSEAFTHITYSQYNYDRLEWSGDGIVNANIIYICYKTYPYYSQSQLTTLKNEFIKNIAFAEASKQYGFIDLLRSRGLSQIYIENVIAGDLVESYFGALFAVCEKVLGKPGSGYVVCRNVSVHMFAKAISEFEPVMDVPNKTFIIQTIDKITGIQKAINLQILSNKENQKPKYTLKISKEAIDALEDKNFDLIERGIFNSYPDGSAHYKIITATNQDTASVKLYSLLYHDFIDLGITEKYMDEFQYKKMIQTFAQSYEDEKEAKNFVKKIRQRQEKEGYDYLKEKTRGTKGTKSHNVETLLGTRYEQIDGQESFVDFPLLVSEIGTGTSKMAKIKILLEAYANGRTIDQLIPAEKGPMKY